MVKSLGNSSGQATVEYILLVSFVAMAFMLLSGMIGDIQLTERLMKPLKQDYARAYQYGNPKAKGYDDGGPLHHPRAVPGSGEGNFRLFINPDATGSGDSE
ncbi:MAG: hypothetical protein A2428_03340 [Bdellovibrionales bacterium RIFOXYC1_FULL_54_43]|nr:MAG: hypothetical protein A2428_03340 [Bdellovibrionales bacterium RIFOXYC1_FULL_54_43]